MLEKKCMHHRQDKPGNHLSASSFHSISNLTYLQKSLQNVETSLAGFFGVKLRRADASLLNGADVPLPVVGGTRKDPILVGIRYWGVVRMHKVNIFLVACMRKDRAVLMLDPAIPSNVWNSTNHFFVKLYDLARDDAKTRKWI